MKNAVAVSGVFVGVLFFGTLIGASIFVVYANLSLYISGAENAVGILTLFFGGISFSFPMFCIVASLMSILYSIRHPSDSVLSLVFFVVLNAVVWLFLLPEILSVNSDKNLILSFIENVRSADANGNDITLLETATRLPSAPISVTLPFALYFQILGAALSAWKTGYLCWLSFASIAFVFSACYGLKRLSEWKLLSGAWTAIIYGLILFFNGYARGGGIFSKFSKDVFDFWNEHGFFTVDDPFVTFVNVAVGFLLVVVGILLYVYRKNSAKRGLE